MALTIPDAGPSVREKRAPAHNDARAFYDRISRAYDLLSGAAERPARRAGIRLLGPRSGEVVLDLGCGTGPDLVGFRRRVGAAGRVVGLDISRGMLEVARRKIIRAGLCIDLVEGDALHLPMGSHSFDAVSVCFSLEIFSQAERITALREIRRVLRRGGRLAVVSMAEVRPGEQGSLAERAYVWLHHHFPRFIDCRPIHLERELAEGGFVVRRKREMEIWSMPVTAALAF